MPSSHLSLDAEASSEKMSSSVLDHAVKVRKPYTITKQRERWTEDEHSKFLDAMKMHGRAWRQIEDHVGTKTAVQIRSHAQKFFTKVVRESAGDSTGEAKNVEIPPPRPKKKPAHPYPRKLGSLPSIRVAEKQEWSLIQKLPVSEQMVTEQDNPLETPVLSAVGSDASSELVNGCTSPDSSVAASDPVGASSSEQENRCQSATTSVENEDKLLAPHNPNMELDLGSDDSVSGVECAPVEAPAPAACLKLFGKMVVMADPQRPPCATIGDAERCPETCSASTGLEGHCESEDIGQHAGQLNSWPSGMTPMFYLLPSHASLQNSSDAGAVPLPWMWAFYGGAPAAAAAAPSSFNSEQDRLPSFREPFDNSSAGPAAGVELSIGCRSTNSTRDQHCTLRLRPSEKSAFRSLKVTTSKPAKGFMPYKRCVPEKKADNQMVVVVVDDGGEEQGVRLCL